MQRSSSHRCEPSGRQDEGTAGVVRHKTAPQFTRFLDTQTWRFVATGENELESAEDSPGDKSLSEVSGAVKLIATTFREPLEAVSINLLVLQDQITEIVEYA